MTSRLKSLGGLHRYPRKKETKSGSQRRLTALTDPAGAAGIAGLPVRVEARDDNRQILRDLLTSADFEVIEAVDGEAGLAAAAANRPDLILMDIQLPVMDGYEATRRLKADAVLHAIPVIAVTSYGLAGDDDKARAAGCDGYISKPYSPRQLLAKVREYLSSVAPTR